LFGFSNNPVNNGSGCAFNNAGTVADQENASSVAISVTPAIQQRHPSAAKGWAKVSGDGTTLRASYNVSGITDGGTGALTISWNVDFSSADFSTPAQIETGTNLVVRIQAVTAGTTRLLCVAPGTGTATDPVNYHCVSYGDQ